MLNKYSEDGTRPGVSQGLLNVIEVVLTDWPNAGSRIPAHCI